MTQERIYHHRSAREVLLEYVAFQQKNDRSFSLRKWTQSMGMTSHSLLTLILQGKRPLSLKKAQQFARGMQLDSAATLYFQTQAQWDLARTSDEKQMIEFWMAQLNPTHSATVLEPTAYQVLSHWVHFAILAMSHLQDFSLDVDSIEARLSGKVSRTEILHAIERLQKLRLIEQVDGQYRVFFDRLSTTNDQKNTAIQAYHQQVLELAQEALQSQSVDEREFQSLCFAIPQEQLPIAKNKIRNFVEQLCQTLTANPLEKTSVYQLNVQFFKLDQPKQTKEKNHV